MYLDQCGEGDCHEEIMQGIALIQSHRQGCYEHNGRGESFGFYAV